MLNFIVPTTFQYVQKTGEVRVRVSMRIFE